MASFIYNSFIRDALTGAIDMDTDTFKVMLAGGSAVESTIDLLATTTSGQKIGARGKLPIRQR